MKDLLNIDYVEDLSEIDDYQYDKEISEENYEVLKEYLKNDYEIIDKMYEYGWITEEQYSILKI